MTESVVLPAERHVEARRYEFLIPAFNVKQAWQFALLASLWLCAIAVLWSWWLQPLHNVDTPWFVVNTAVLAWVTLTPGYFLFMFGRSRVPNPALGVPRSYRVAMVVTKASSEPFPVVRRTLLAMLRQDYPHDTWLADEDPSAETIAWCREHGVKVSSRKGRADYHRPDWPRRTRCKEGNLAYFYDHFGYRNYEFVVQMDADHVPEDHYLEEMLRPFADPSVGYVSAPSICDANAEASWSARSRLFVEATLHGALQIGHNNGFAPLCIGSHYAVRTTALQLIGGLGPELAEDHSTTLLMNAAGWRGVHALNAIAGDGPATFADLATQEFQWSRSLITILLRYTPRYLAELPLRLKLQFLYCQLWYPLFSVMMLLMYAMPLVALARDKTMVDVTYPDFLVRFGLVSAILVAMSLWWRGNGWSRPREAKIMSWEGALFLFARWPWSLYGVFAGVSDWIRGSEAEFRVTPKGSDGARTIPFRVLLPYAVLSSIASAATLLFKAEAAPGFYVFAAMNALVYGALLVVIVTKPRRECSAAEAVKSRALGALGLVRSLVLAAVLLLVVGSEIRATTGFPALMIGVDKLFPWSQSRSGPMASTSLPERIASRN